MPAHADTILQSFFLQEELCEMLTQLVHELSTVESKMLFVSVFFITEAREWNSIDVWRLDKFMMVYDIAYFYFLTCELSGQHE